MDERSKTIGRNVAKFRKAAGMSGAELAKAIGVKSQNTIAAIEGGKTQKSKHLHDIARVLKVSIRDIDPRAEENETLMVPLPKSGIVEDFEVFSSAECGDGAIVLSNVPIQMIARPEPLARTRGGYGVLVVGESMSPAVRAGATVWVNPHLSPRVGDLCLFVHDENGDFVATIKEYLGQTADSWLVKRYKPKERRMTLAKRQWPKCHVIVGQHYGR